MYSFKAANWFCAAFVPLLCYVEIVQSTCAPLKPVPTSVVCGKPGQLDKSEPACAPQIYSTYQACTQSCFRRSQQAQLLYAYERCISFSYDPASGICELYSANLMAQGFESQNSSSTKFWDLGCLKCPDPCPQPYNTNLFQNSGFELPLFGPWYNDSNVFVTSPGRNSAHAATCFKSCELDQSTNACSNSFYHLSLDFMIIGPKIKNKPDYLDLYGYFWYALVTGTGEWQNLQVWFSTPDDYLYDLEISFYGYTKKQIYHIDNVALERVPNTFTTSPGAVEQMRNGGFESGAIGPWAISTSPSDSFTVVLPGIDSKYALQFSGHTRAKDLPSTLAQTLSLVVGKAYLLTFTAVQQNPNAHLPIVFTGEFTVDNPTTQITNGTLSYALPFYPLRNKVTILLQVTHGPLLIDNVSIKELALS